MRHDEIHWRVQATGVNFGCGCDRIRLWHDGVPRAFFPFCPCDYPVDLVAQYEGLGSTDQVCVVFIFRTFESQGVLAQGHFFADDCLYGSVVYEHAHNSFSLNGCEFRRRHGNDDIDFFDIALLCLSKLDRAGGKRQTRPRSEPFGVVVVDGFDPVLEYLGVYSALVSSR